ncbi:OLC1v1027613C1 [Oldenlandia corymbosa var. corymbosa]|uniref:OLC1v1027613C1 n=1 Tax=Oldenlandia corymbosa var. corymbosa TaxID=529605 RepID=A0AAV1CAM2_OLDCO|nr:OLC1v1027613C1 [Oldenlandia corymbosa var. corymbosa]
MLGRRFLSVLRTPPSSSPIPPASALAEEGSGKSGKTWGRRAVSGVLICLTGGVALSALDDLAIYHGCSSKAMEKASKNQAVIDAIGEPIERGPWYNASLAVAHKRHSVSCTFPVAGPQGTGIFQLKAIRNGDDTLFTFLRPRDWEVIVLEALLHVPGTDEKQQTVRISVAEYPPAPGAPACKACTTSTAQPPECVVDKKT